MLARTPNDELDAGPRKGGPGTERLCALTRAVKPVDELIRFVVGPDGVVPDLKRKLPGRGLWITGEKAALKDAVTRNVFARGFKRELRVTPELVEQTERLLVRGALDALAIAGKAGLVTAGFAKAEAAIARDTIVGLIHATDAGTDGVAKLSGALRRRDDTDGIASSRLSRRPNWIWHWDGQMWYMQPCLPGLQMTRFWRDMRALSAFGPARRAKVAPSRGRN